MLQYCETWYLKKVFKIIKLLGEISNNFPNDLLGTNVYKTLKFCS